MRETAMGKKSWISATVDETYASDAGIDFLKEGDTVILEIDEDGHQTWRVS